MRASMKHWRPDTRAVPLHPDKRRRRRDWTSLGDYAPPRPRPQAHEMRAASRVGLALVAAVCIVVGIGAYFVLAPPMPVDRAAALTG